MSTMPVPSQVRQRWRLAASPFAPAGGSRAARLALAAIVAYSLAQVAFLTINCDWDLCGDEAEYWAWSRKLDWSYFTRGPLIALVVRAGVDLFGGVSLALTGSLTPAVRLPAVLLSAWTAWAVFRLGSETCRSPRVGLLAVIILPAVATFRLGGVVMTCDTPLICCWAWAAVWSYRATQRDSLRAWMIAALWTALGVAAKYTMLALPVSVGLYLLLDPARRGQLLRPGIWLLAIGALAGIAPVIYWNACHDWVAMTHLADRVGMDSTRGFQIMPFLSFLAGEAAGLNGWAVLGVLALRVAVPATLLPARRGGWISDDLRLDHVDGPDFSFLVCLWGVIWTTCLVVSLRGETEMNWSVPGQLSLVILIAWLLIDRFAVSSLRAAVRSPRVVTVAAFWLASMAGLTLLQHTEWIYPLVGRIIPPPTVSQPAPLRGYDPTARMKGTHDFMPEVASRVNALRARGLDPFVLTPTYASASLVSFYLPGQPEVYCLSWSPGFAARVVTQHDLWHPNPRHDLATFRGRPAVIVEDAEAPPGFARGLVRSGVFHSADEPSRFVSQRSGLVVSACDVTICYDYQGPQNVELYRNYLDRYASPAYFQAQGGTAEGYVRGLYRDLLQQTPTVNEVGFWSKVLTGQCCELLVVEFLKIRGIVPRTTL